MTRFRIPLLSAALLLAAVAGAQGAPYVNLYFYKTVTDQATGESRDVSTPYGTLDVTVSRTAYYEGAQEAVSEEPLSPGLRMLTGERFRVLVVYSEGSLSADVIPFEIDALGNVIGCTKEYAWATFGSGTSSELRVREVPGVPVELNADGTPALVTAHATRALTAPSEKATFFLVTLDSRMPNAVDGKWTIVEGAPVARYGVARLAEVGMLAFGATNVAVAVGEESAPVSGYALNVGNPAPVRPTAALTSYVDESGQTIAEDELAALVTPTLQAAPADAEDGALTVVPSVGLPLYRYAVETADSLGGEWELLDDWVAREKIPETAPLGYSAIVPDGRTPLILPRKAGETSRFYRLVAPGK